ncbi:MAG: PD40 domain-containing protein [Bacteroidales bacterium]|nr:PD40 domain-containing protein [Bacteroidales bacterium]
MNKLSTIFKVAAFAAALFAAFNLSGATFEGQPDIFPDYKDVTIPPNIAPLNFRVNNAKDAVVTFETAGYSLKIKGRGENGADIRFRIRKWRRLLDAARGGEITVKVTAVADGRIGDFEPFSIKVSEEPIDKFLAYRLIDPGYETWNNMGIYQRNLENFRQTAVVTNSQTDKNCMNCHNFCNRSPQKMVMHMRAVHGCTLVLDNGKVEKLNTKTPQTISALVYPQWHPSGRFIAFSVNDTGQAFHSCDANRIEVYDMDSDVVVYDTETHEIISCPLLMDTLRCETFPTFSPDGTTLYFCSAQRLHIPEEFDDARYDIFSVSFDAESRTFGSRIDTVFCASELGHSASFPRISPDGRRLLFTFSDYGNFSIWHKAADLWMTDLQDGHTAALDAVNSDDVDSYHSWSGNSRWIVVSSRRGDGLYTRPYFAYIAEDGTPGKAFLLPQKDLDYYDSFLKSYNIPEFVTGRVKPSVRRALAREAIKSPGTDLTFLQR